MSLYSCCRKALTSAPVSPLKQNEQREVAGDSPDLFRPCDTYRHQRQHKPAADMKQDMASQLPEPNVPNTRDALVDMARSRNGCPRYLSGLPSGMLQTLDPAVIVDGQVLPAHSFVLMAMSPVFCEALSTRPELFHTQQVLQVPLPGSKDTSEDLIWHWSTCTTTACRAQETQASTSKQPLF